MDNGSFGLRRGQWRCGKCLYVKCFEAEPIGFARRLMWDVRAIQVSHDSKALVLNWGWCYGRVWRHTGLSPLGRVLHVSTSGGRYAAWSVMPRTAVSNKRLLGPKWQQCWEILHYWWETRLRFLSWATGKMELPVTERGGCWWSSLGKWNQEFCLFRVPVRFSRDQFHILQCYKIKTR